MNNQKLISKIKRALPNMQESGLSKHLRSLRIVNDSTVEIKWNNCLFYVSNNLNVKEKNFNNELIETPASREVETILKSKKNRTAFHKRKLKSPLMRVK